MAAGAILAAGGAEAKEAAGPPGGSRLSSPALLRPLDGIGGADGTVLCTGSGPTVSIKGS